MPPAAITLALLLALTLAISIALALHAMANMLLHPPRMTDGKALYILRRMSPGDLGLSFEPMSFDVRDRDAAQPIRIDAWWIAAANASQRTCIMIHGFADAKVGALAWATTWRDLGWNLLLIDLRAHGESGGRMCTGGFFERDDLDAVIDQLRRVMPDQTQRLALFGVSLGAAVALATAARRDDIEAVVADSVFADYKEAAVAHGRLIGAPLPALTPLAVRWAAWSAGASFDAVRPLDALVACRCPVMLIHGDDDPFVPDDVIRVLDATLESRKNARDVHYIVPGAGHCMAIVADAHKYSETLRTFLNPSDESTTHD